MKKRTKIMAAFMLSVMMIATVSDCAWAETYSWSATKVPGTTVGAYVLDIPLYKGEMTFQVTELYGNCSYLLGKIASNDESLYYVNNSARSVMITKVGGSQSFYMKFINDDDDYMHLRVSVEHNASVGELAYAKGLVTY